jgi:hypothetical protein
MDAVFWILIVALSLSSTDKAQEKSTTYLSTSMVTVLSPVLLGAGVTPADRCERLVADDIPLRSHDSGDSACSPD